MARRVLFGGLGSLWTWRSLEVRYLLKHDFVTPARIHDGGRFQSPRHLVGIVYLVFVVDTLRPNVGVAVEALSSLN